MELIELETILQQTRVGSLWSCEVSKHGCLLVGKKPTLIQFRPSLESTRSVPFSFTTLEITEPTKRDLAPDEQTALNLNSVSQLLLEPSLANLEPPWIRRLAPLTDRASWSPGDSGYFALLTDTGHVTIWDSHGKRQLLRLPGEEVLPVCLSDESLPKLKEDCEASFVTAMCWYDTVHKNERETFTYFVTAYKTGTFKIWKVIFLKSWNYEVDVRSVHTCEVGMKNVTAISWITAGYDNMLAFGNSSGQIRCLNLRITGESDFKVSEGEMIYAEADKLAVDKIFWEHGPENQICIFAIKLSYFLAIVIDSNCKVLHVAFENLGNHYVTSLKKIDKFKYIASTYTGKIFNMNLTINLDNKPTIDSQEISCNVNFDSWSLRGMYFTENTSFCILCLTPCKSTNRKNGMIISKLVITYLKEPNYLNHILNNETKLLTNFWDSLILTKILNINLSTMLKKDTDDTYETKVSMWINLVNSKHSEQFMFNEELYYLILFDHVKTSLIKYTADSENLNNFNSFQLTTVSLYIKFLQNCSGLVKRPMPDEVIQNALMRFSNKLPDTKTHCDWCDEEIKTIFCSKRHPRQWCCVTLQTIEDAKCLRCPLCGSVAHPDLYLENPICVFCDSYFERNLMCFEI